MIEMKKMELTKNDIASVALLFIGAALLMSGIALKSLLVLAGVGGLVVAWFLCIDNIIANHKMNTIKRIVFGGIVVFIPLLFAMYLGS